MSEPFDMKRYIADAMNDPERSERINAHREEIRADRERYLERSVFAIFANVARADQLQGVERDAVVDETVDLILEDPGLSSVLLNAFDEFQEDDEEETLYDQVQRALLEAADPITGQLPVAFRLDPELQAVLESDSVLQEYQSQLPSLIHGDSDKRRRHVADYMTPILREFNKPRVMSGEWMFIDADTVGATEEEYAFVNRSFVLKGADEQEAKEIHEPEPGDVRTLFTEDPDGYYRLGETRIYEGDDKYTVILRAYYAGSFELLAESREGWRLHASIGERKLEVGPDDFYPDAWRLVDQVPAVELAQVMYEVESLVGYSRVSKPTYWTLSISDVTPDSELTSLGATRGLVGAHEEELTSTDERDGWISERYWHDDEGLYTLAEYRTWRTSSRAFEVTLQLCEFGTAKPLGIGRDGWKVFPTVGDRRLDVVPSENEEWAIREQLKKEEWSRLAYEVRLFDGK